ncbi:hypothetical protein FLK61_38610 [Paenalkalicoccus suaedae]|uniref:Uncharacterized protein n=1 Tax=Paenalkalicoccus suaedae TaxID=2592382 RepID=A0A859FJ77_9BACI|nr:hypothetical protein [Paenalkalicoccus suaedae]QKS72535.1 hypothetical protein FLK61_38610 [Paenalkalicoccus suaedae]
MIFNGTSNAALNLVGARIKGHDEEFVVGFPRVAVGMWDVETGMVGVDETEDCLIMDTEDSERDPHYLMAMTVPIQSQTVERERASEQIIGEYEDFHRWIAATMNSQVECHRDELSSLECSEAEVERNYLLRELEKNSRSRLNAAMEMW